MPFSLQTWDLVQTFKTHSLSPQASEPVMPAGWTLRSYHAIKTDDRKEQADWFPKFVGLPNELRLKVFHYLPDNADLRHVRETMVKNIFPLTTSLMYKEVSLVFGKELKESMKNMFTRENSGLDLLRSLTVAIDVQNCHSAAQAYGNVQMAMNCIAKNRLTHFSFQGHRPVPPTFYKALWQTQRKLENLELFPSDDIDPYTRLATENDAVDLEDEIDHVEFPNLKAVRVVPNNTRVAELGLVGMEYGDVTSLEVDGRHWGSDQQNFPPAVNMNGMHDPMVEGLFSHIKRVTTGAPGNLDILTTLILRDIDLEQSQYTWFTYLDLRKLERLELYHCKNVDMFLIPLVSRTVSPPLKSLTIVHSLDAQADRTISMINNLLTLQQGLKSKLEKLVLCLRNANALPKAEAVCAHAESLRVMLFDVKGCSNNGNAPVNNGWNGSDDDDDGGLPKYLVYDPENFEKILKCCRGLVELGIAMPYTNLEFANFDDCGNFAAYTNLLADHLKLTTLNIVNMPLDYKPNRSLSYYAQRDDTLSRLAECIFAAHRRADQRPKGDVRSATFLCSLESVTFGVRERRRDALSPRHFLPFPAEVPRGKVRYFAAQVGLCEMIREGMDSTILDYEKRDFDLNSRRRFRGVEREGEDDDDYGGGW